MNLINTRRVIIVNPLGGALKHYVAELEDVIGEVTTDTIVEIEAFDEPSISGSGKSSWCWRYLRTLTKLRRKSGALVLIVWPVFGYLDLLLVRLIIGHDACVVVHDTKPLVRAVGHDRFSRALAGISAPMGSVIIHSVAAYEDLRSGRLQRKSVVLPHPILDRSSNDLPVPAASRAAVVRALGQYKPDRDLDALRGMSAGAVSRGAILEVVGRGWPLIEGWSVIDEFVPEAQLDALIQSSDVVLIPYRHFYQSGIAIRCLEHGVAVVGPAGTNLEDLLGLESHLLVQESRDPSAEWWRAVDHAISNRGEEAGAAARNWRQKTLQSWREFLALQQIRHESERIHSVKSPS